MVTDGAGMVGNTADTVADRFGRFAANTDCQDRPLQARAKAMLNRNPPDVVCRGRAAGDTSKGFPGDDVIGYYGADGEHVGDLDWHIEPVAESYRLNRRNREGNNLIPVPPGELVFERFGFPNSEHSIVVPDWMGEKTSSIMRGARAGAQGPLEPNEQYCQEPGVTQTTELML
ncbi:hypothetical protein [Nocardia sp.]|uniref:hypothetical protein n=1 Tax=Nocardia sp. TaxID=1821 RepID=UPI002610E299|nr:hypothetical protein [Nocardia sp.]